MNRAVFLDRDGVINAAVITPQGLDSPRSVDELTLLPGVGGAIRALNEHGMLVIVVSNQPGVAKGKLERHVLDAITESMSAMLRAEGATLDGIYYCLHHPDAVRDDYKVACDCRKPRPGLLLRAASDLNVDLCASFMVGDQPRDIAAGRAAGCTTVLVGGSAHSPTLADADFVVNDLSSTVALIQNFELATQQRGGN